MAFWHYMLTLSNITCSPTIHYSRKVYLESLLPALRIGICLPLSVVQLRFLEILSVSPAVAYFL